MDVRCDRCSTEYEFDEEKVTLSGVTVKCANCGHIFKVRRRDIAGFPTAQSPILPPASGGQQLWMVRKSGTQDIYRFRELTTLQQWIVERRVTRQDEVSRTGTSWKPLGQIAELTAFFNVVDQAANTERLRVERPGEANGSASAAASAIHQGNPSGPQSAQGAQSPTNPLGSTPKAAYAPTVGMPACRPSGPAGPTGPFGLAGSTPAPRTGGKEPTQPYAIAAGQSGPMTLGSVPAIPIPREPTFSGFSGAVADDFDDLYPAGMRPRRRFATFFMIILLAGAGGGLYARRDQVMRMIGGRAAPGSDVTVRQARAAFEGDTDNDFAYADHQFELALGASPGSPAALSGLGELYATWGLYLREDGRLIDDQAKTSTLAGEAAVLRARAEEKRREAQQKLDQARVQAGDAVGRAPEDFAANRAQALWLVAAGKPLEEVQRSLAKTQAVDPDTLFVQGMLALREGHGEEAEKSFREAIRRAGDRPLLRARFFLARASLSLGHKEDARLALDEIVRLSSRHERARALLAWMNAQEAVPKGAQAELGGAPAGAAPAPGAPGATPLPSAGPDTQVSTVSGGAAEEGKSDGEGGGKQGKPAAKTDDKAAAKGDDKPAAKETYDSFVTKGNRLLEQGKDRAAKEAFEGALKLRPNGPEAETGVGNFYVSVGRLETAIQHFRRATERGYGEAFFYMGEAQRAQGALSGALASYRKYLDRGGHGENLGIAQRNLRELSARLEGPARVPPKPRAQLPPPDDAASALPDKAEKPVEGSPAKEERLLPGTSAPTPAPAPTPPPGPATQ